MMRDNVSHHLIDNYIFLPHVWNKANVDPESFIHHVYGDDVTTHINNLKMLHHIDLFPYYYITDVLMSKVQRAMFYTFLNLYISKVSEDVHISCFSDIHSCFEVLCYIYLVQYYFL